jgi:cytochrome c peroxidase
MGLANVGYFGPLTWADPAQTSLEAQVAVPVTGEHPVEMGMHGQEAEIVRRLSADACYRTMFAAAFPETHGEISFPATAKAIAAFERTMVSWDTPYDRRALEEEALRGEAVFRARGCAGCHAGWNFTDGRFHVLAEPRGEDQGVVEKTGRVGDRGAFRTPGLRNVELTGPWLHDGSARTLGAAMLAHGDAAPRPDDLVSLEAFLSGLTDVAFTKDPRFSLPTETCGKPRSR